MTGKRSGLGRCRHFFWLGVLFDTVGAAVLFTGVFADLFFYDMLLYLGAIIIFFSLLWWVSWYTGNIELLPEDALPSGPRRPSDSVVRNIRRSVSLRFSQTFATFAVALQRVRRRGLRGRSPRLTPQTTPWSLSVPDVPEGGRKSVDARDVCRERAGPTPADDGRSEAVGAPGPATASRTHLEWPAFPQYSGEGRPPLPIHLSKSQPVTPLPSALKPDAFPAARSDVLVSLPSAGRPPVTLPVTSQLAVPGLAQSHPSLPVLSRDHSLVSVTSQSENLSHSQLFSVKDSESQILTPQVSEMPLLSTQSFQNVGLQPSPEIRDFVTVYHSQQFSKSSLLQEPSNRSSDLLEMSKKIVAQVFESLPLPIQKPPQQIPDPMTPVSEAADPASQSQQSVPTDIVDLASESQQSVPTDMADPATGSQQSVPTDMADPASASQQSAPTDSALALWAANKVHPL
ncbi:Transmembrane protein 238 [Sciurus carolinensis]|uniref:Transmembrane protein 238 n=2 Tax=Sciurus carolinensis TaxID=30640 RepID=A0AA41SWL9_SCICA|nr:Transmembrane protein 238 [Sciurus carolinensis]